MPIKRVTISMPLGIARQVKRAAGRQSISAWLSGLVEAHLDEAELERQWEAFYERVAPKGTAIRRANSLFDRLTRPRGRRRVA